MKKYNDADASDKYPASSEPPKDGKYGSSQKDESGSTVSAPPAGTDQV